MFFLDYEKISLTTIYQYKVPFEKTHSCRSRYHPCSNWKEMEESWQPDDPHSLGLAADGVPVFQQVSCTQHGAKLF